MVSSCKRILLVLLSFVLCLGNARAQNAGALADTAFKQGKYADAAQLYDLAASTESDADKRANYYTSAKNSRNCARYIAEAADLYDTALLNDAEVDYKAAKSRCQSVLKYNKNDKEARRILDLCDEKLAFFAAAKAEEELWARVISDSTITAYNEYLAEYPSGAHSDEAREQLANYADQQLWQAALAVGTIEAYEDYLAGNPNGRYRSEAQSEITAIKREAALAAQIKAKQATEREAELAAQRKAEEEAKREATRAAKRKAEQAAKREAELATRREAELAQAEKNKEYAAYQAFISSPSISEGRQFLRIYPSGEYRDKVSNTVATLYLKGLNENSPDSDFALAKSYAVDAMLAMQIADKEKEIKEKKEAAARAASTQTAVSSSVEKPRTGNTGTSPSRPVVKTYKYKQKKNRVWLEVGLDIESDEKVSAAAPRLGLKFGAPSDFFNFYMGVKYMSFDTDNFMEEVADPSLAFSALPVYAGIKLGVLKVGTNGRVYLAAEGSYSIFTDSGYFTSEEDGGFEYDISVVNSNVWDLSGKIGVAMKWFDFGVYYKYLMTPVFNEQYLIDAGYAYEHLSSNGYFGDFTSKYRYGVYLNIALRLGKKK